MMYIAITGLRLHGPLHAPRFWLHAARSMKQAQSAEGNIYADARTIDGVHHTLSAWRDRKAMAAFLATGAHGRAMKVFPKIATGGTVGYLADRIPDWNEARLIWQQREQPA